MQYTVMYKLHEADNERMCIVIAKNKVEAYEKAVFEEIPGIHEEGPYSAWVAGVTYNNGNYHRFKTWEGLPY